MKIIEDEKKLRRLKGLTLISSFGLGVGVLLCSYIFVEAVTDHAILKEFASLNGILNLLKQMVISGIVYALAIYGTADTKYKMKIIEEEGNDLKKIVKISIECILKIIIFMVVLLFLDIKSVDVGAVYSVVGVLGAVIFSIIYIAQETVKELNQKLNEKRNKK